MSEALKLEEVSTIHKKKILVIDDDKDMNILVKKALDKKFDVVIVDNASEALDITKEISPFGIFLDLNMPNIDGFGFLNMINNDSNLCDIPVIAMTANKSESYRKRAFEEGAVGIINKPFDIKHLSRDIEGMLNSTESSLVSESNRIKYHIEFSENRKKKKIKDILSTQDFQNEPLVLLSWSRGEDYLNDLTEVKEHLTNEEFIFLEIKPSLISKFPYIQNITPIVEEVKGFLLDKSRNYHLILEEPRHLLNIHQREKSISQAYNMAQLLNSEFKKVTYVNSRPHSEDAVKFLMKMGKILSSD